MFETITNFEYEAFAFRDNWKTIALTVALLLTLYLTLTWIATNVVGQTEVIFVYFSFLLLFAAAYFVNILKKHIPKLQPLPFGTVSIGWSPKTIALLTVIALAVSWFLVTQKMTVALPLDVSFKQTISSMNFIYKVVMSPIIEELFRAVVLISSALIVWHYSRSWWFALLAGLLISAFSFGIFHWLAYQQEFVFIGAAIVFGLIAGLLMIVSKSIVPSIAFHFANNQLVFSEGEPTAVIIAIGVAAAMLGVFLLRRWK